MGNRKKWEKRKEIVLIIVFGFLLTSIVYCLYKFTQAPVGLTESAGERVKIDYLLLSMQSGMGAILVFLPRKLEKLLKRRIPDIVQVMYLVFLFLTIFLGGVRNFYYHIPIWDRFLHFFSAGMLVMLGIYLFDLGNGLAEDGVRASPGTASFFAFCFATAFGAIWEIYEYASDGLIGTNMQKYISYEREVLAGQEVLFDTMGDLVVNLLGALMAAFLGYCYLRHNPSKKTKGEWS